MKYSILKYFVFSFVLYIILFINCDLSAQPSPVAGDFKSNGSGNWDDETKWLRYDGSSWQIPAKDHFPGGLGEGGKVTILNGDAIIINTSTTTNITGLTIGEGFASSLRFSDTGPYVIRVSGNVTINTNAELKSSSIGTEKNHELRLTGDLLNNGTLDFSTNSNNAGAILTFSGSSDGVFYGSGINNIRMIHVEKTGDIHHYIDIQLDNFLIKGSNYDSEGFLTMTTGGCRIKGNFVFSSVLFPGTTYTLNQYSELVFNNPNFILIGNINYFTIEGNLFVYGGTLNFGTNLFVAGGRFHIYGGTLNVAGNLSIYNYYNAPSFIMSNGVLNIATAGFHDDLIPTIQTFGSYSTAFNLWGGTINLVHPNTGSGGDIDITWSTIEYGGTIIIGTGATPENSTFKVKGPLPKIIVDNTNYSKNLIIAGNTTIHDDLIFGSGTLKLESGTLTTINNVTLGNNSTIDRSEGTLSKAPIFGTSVNIIYSGTSAVSSSFEFPSGSTVLNNLTINNSAGVNIGVFATVSSKLYLLSGNLTISGILTLANNTIITRSGGTLGAEPAFGSSVDVVYEGSTALSASYEIPSSSSVLRNLTVNNSGGVNLSNSTTVNNKLILSAGTLTTGGLLTIVNNATIERSAGSLSASPIFGTNVKISYTGTSLISTSYELPSSATILSDLKIDNSAGVNLNQDLTVNGTLFLNNGSFSIGSNTLTVNRDIIKSSGIFTGGANSNIKVTSITNVNLPAVTLKDLILEKTNNLTLTGAVNIGGTLYLNSGNLVPNGNLIIYDNANIIRSDGYLSGVPIFNGSVNVTYSGSNPLTSSYELPLSTSALKNLTINNSAGITLNAAVTSESLTLTNGVLSTDATNVITVSGTKENDVSGGSSSSFVKGPIVRSIPNTASGLTYLFPIGKSAYKPLELTNVTTGGTGNATFKAEVFDANSGGTTGNELTSLNTNRYWKISANTGSVTISSISVRLTESDLTSINKIGQCNTLNGSYDSRGGLLEGNTLQSTTALNLGSLSTGTFFVIGSFNAITKTVGGTGGANYATLKLAFDNINSGDLAGYIILQVISNTTEASTAILNSNGTKSSSYTNVLIYPTSSGIAISGNISGAVIDLNGADNVIIDGRANRTGSSTDLTIANTNTGSSNALKFENDASNNFIQYCKFKTVSNAVDSYVLFFTNPSSLGNNNNYLQYCEIYGETNYPNSSVYSLGNTSAVNSGNVISHCKIHDFANFGVLLGVYNNNWRIDTNYIYQVNSSASSTQQCISINSTECLFQIKGNIIGGSASDGSGTWTNTAASSTIYPLYLLGGNTSTVNNVQYNTIKNFSQTNIGQVYFVGIYAGSSGYYNISENTISNISQPNTTNTNTFNGVGGIYFDGITNGVTINQNSIHDLSSSSRKNLNLVSSNPNTGYLAVFGILSNSSAANQSISQNIIYSLNATSTTNLTCAIGISVDEQAGATGCIISRNRIYGINNISTYNSLGITAGISGMRFYASEANNSVWTISNNQVSLTNGSNTNSIHVNGFCYLGNAANVNLYYNTFYTGGSISSGSRNTYCLYSASGNLTLLNNIIYMGRTGGTAKYYSIYWSGGTLTKSNNNLLISTNLNTIGYFTTGTNYDKTIDSWRTATSQDNNSWSTVSTNIPAGNLFSDYTNGNLNIKTDQQEAWYVNGKGTPTGTGINNDYVGNARSTTVSTGATDIGANEFTPSSTPPAATETGSRTNGGTTYYNFGGQILASITWGSGTIPGVVNVRYYSNSQVSSPSGNYGNGYWDVSVDVQPSSAYNITFYFGDHETYTINSPSQSTIDLAKYSSGVWTNFPSGSTGNNVSITSFTYNPHTVTVNGITTGFSKFALSDDNAPLPVNILSFNSGIINLRDVELKWEVENESNMNCYEIYRQSEGSENWLKVGNIISQNHSERIMYKFKDSKLNSGKYHYKLKQIDNNGNFAFSLLSNPVEINLPTKFELSQNYPNPFNPKTKIDFNLPFDSKIDLKVYDITGKEIANIIKGEYYKSGFYTMEFDCNRFASGVYFYKITAVSGSNVFVNTKKMILLK